MTAADSTPQPPQLPPREPRSLLVHVVVDTAVVLLATVLMLWIVGVAIWIAVIVAVILGACAAPFTRRAEERALAQRYEAGPGSPAAS